MVEVISDGTKRESEHPIKECEVLRTTQITKQAFMFVKIFLPKDTAPSFNLFIIFSFIVRNKLLMS